MRYEQRVEEGEERLGINSVDGHSSLVVKAYVVDERVHDGHGLGRNSSIRMDLLQDLVDVNLVGLGLGRGPLARGPLLRNLLRGLLGRRLISLNSHCCWFFVDCSASRGAKE